MSLLLSPYQWWQMLSLMCLSLATTQNVVTNSISPSQYVEIANMKKKAYNWLHKTPILIEGRIRFHFLLKCLENLLTNITNICDQIKRQLWPHAFVENENWKLEETNNQSGLLFSSNKTNSKAFIINHLINLYIYIKSKQWSLQSNW